MRLKLAITYLIFTCILSVQAQHPDDVDADYKVHGVESTGQIDQATLDAWSAPYRGWHYHADPIIPSDLNIPGYETFHSFDVPTVYQIQDHPGKWFMSFIGFLLGMFINCSFLSFLVDYISLLLCIIIGCIRLFLSLSIGLS